MSSFSKLNYLVENIDDAFQSFYDSMLKDAKLAVFFNSQEQILNLIQKQKEYFKASLNMPIDILKSTYIKLGEFHYDLRIPYVDYVRGTKILEEHFLIFASNKNSSEEQINEIFKYFKIMISFTAKGYLNRMLLEDKKDIQDFFEESSKLGTFLPKNVMIKKFEWLKNLINYIESNKYFDEELEENLIKEWFEDNQFLVDIEKRTFFEDLEKRISINIQNLFYFLHKEEYLEILPLYTSLLNIYKLALMINNTITIEYANKFIEQLKLDSQTKLFRKDVFEEILKKENLLVRRHENYSSCLVYIDIDDFKNINDNYGHHCGDKVIEKLGEFIRNTIRASDYGFRIGGDEFALILKHATSQQAKKVCEKIKLDFTEYSFIFNDTSSFRVSLSIGLSAFSKEDNFSVEQIIANTDKKLYQAKHLGKNQICL